jgi:hypothetical protein
MNYFKEDDIYVADLQDDFIMNHKLSLYDFINGDIVKAYYLGLNIREWMTYLDKEQQYLHTKSLRHNRDSLLKYQSQFEYWIDKYPEKNVSSSEILSYLLDNMYFWDVENEESDMVKLALFFGITDTDQRNKEKEKEKEEKSKSDES